jgi:hypothetical protein
MKIGSRQANQECALTVVRVKQHAVKLPRDASHSLRLFWFQECSKLVGASLCTGPSEQLPVRCRGPPHRRSVHRDENEWNSRRVLQ